MATEEEQKAVSWHCLMHQPADGVSDVALRWHGAFRGVAQIHENPHMLRIIDESPLLAEIFLDLVGIFGTVSQRHGGLGIATPDEEPFAIGLLPGRFSGDPLRDQRGGHPDRGRLLRAPTASAVGTASGW